MVITSKDNEIVKHIRKLRDKKARDEFGEFIIEGAKLIEEAVRENVKIKIIVVCEELNQAQISKDVLYKIAKEKVIYVNDKIFKILTDVTTPQGILAVVEKNNKNEIDFSQELYLVLDNIQDPRKYGNNFKNCW